MIRLIQSPPETHFPVTSWSGHWVCGLRIERSRAMLLRALEGLTVGASIVELGCGAADVCGPLSGLWPYTGVDGSPDAIVTAKMRWPDGSFARASIERARPFPAGALCLFEVLEHLNDPEDLVKRWLPEVDACVISHPLNEKPADDDRWSRGYHLWSYSEADFDRWFEIGGHEIVEKVIFDLTWPGVGKCKTILGRSRRKESRPE